MFLQTGCSFSYQQGRYKPNRSVALVKGEEAGWGPEKIGADQEEWE